MIRGDGHRGRRVGRRQGSGRRRHADDVGRVVGHGQRPGDAPVAAAAPAEVDLPARPVRRQHEQAARGVLRQRAGRGSAGRRRRAAGGGRSARRAGRARRRGRARGRRRAGRGGGGRARRGPGLPGRGGRARGSRRRRRRGRRGRRRRDPRRARIGGGRGGTGVAGQREGDHRDDRRDHDRRGHRGHRPRRGAQRSPQALHAATAASPGAAATAASAAGVATRGQPGGGPVGRLGEPAAGERPRPAEHGRAVRDGADPLAGRERDRVRAEAVRRAPRELERGRRPGRQRRTGRQVEQDGRAQLLGPSVAAGRALLDVPVDALAEQDRQPAVPAGQQGGELVALAAPGPAHQQHRQARLKLLAGPRQQRAGMVAGDAEYGRHLGRLQALAQLELDDLPLARVQPGGGVLEQRGQVGALAPTAPESSVTSDATSSADVPCFDRRIRSASCRATAYSHGRSRLGSRSPSSRDAAMTKVS